LGTLRLDFLGIMHITTVLMLLLIVGGNVHPNPGPSNKLKMCHLNIRSILSDPIKMDQIRCELAPKYDIIALSETWLKSTKGNTNLLIEGYQSPFRVDRPNNAGYGGVYYGPKTI
jgi:hypothetical protein